MKTNPYRSHSAAAAVAAALVTTVLTASLVESFEPSQLLRIDAQPDAEHVVAQARRADSAPAPEWT